jgi:hypothetical protein
MYAVATPVDTGIDELHPSFMINTPRVWLRRIRIRQILGERTEME